MSPALRRSTLVAGIAALALVGAGVGVGQVAQAWLARQAHRDRGEIEIYVRMPAGATVTAYRAGAALDEARPISLADDAWLASGNYFLEVGRGGARQLFPVPLEGFRIGPDSGGVFAVTVRGLGAAPPTGPDERLSRFEFVPGGHFLMGDRGNPGQCHYVWVSGFFLGAFEVTNAEYRRFLADPQGFEARENWTSEGWGWKTQAASQATALLAPSHPDYRRFGADDLPVVLVTWHEANAYCRWLTRRLGAGAWRFRMPTEAEWEKAARGPDSFDYGLGARLSEPESGLYNWKKNPGAEVTLVGVAESRARFRPNRFGVYHASGNAAEWTQSVSRHYNARQPFRDDDRNQDETTGLRVTRGGSWYSATTSRLHLAYREEFQPNMSSNDLGFRVAAVPAPGRD